MSLIVYQLVLDPVYKEKERERERERERGREEERGSENNCIVVAIHTIGFIVPMLSIEYALYWIITA